MEYLELSIEKSIEESEKLYNKVKEDYDFDLVIFIAKGSYIIGKKISELGNTPLLEIYATRQGNKLKNIISPMLRIIPRKILVKLREKEMNSNYHETKNDRKVCFNREKYLQYKEAKKILLVDDSIDSGNSITLTTKEIKEIFSDSQIKVAVVNVMSKSKVKPDYFLYNDKMISGPWSNDSKENRKYKKMYEEWKHENG